MVALDRLARSAQSTTQTGLWTAEGYRRPCLRRQPLCAGASRLGRSETPAAFLIADQFGKSRLTMSHGLRASNADG